MSLEQLEHSILVRGTQTLEIFVCHLVVVPVEGVETEHGAEVIRSLFDPEGFEKVESS